MFNKKETSTINRALTILESSLKREPFTMSSSKAVGQFCQLRFGGLPHEVFAILMLDNQHQLITVSEMFRGTIDGAAVYPREVAKEVLIHNAAAVVFVHNHPSGVTEPSHADIAITRRLKSALETIEVRVLDHIVVSATGYTSFAERGLL